VTDEHVDWDIEARLEELWETPVGRRWLLKAGLGSAVVAGAQMYAGPALAASSRIASRAAVPGELQFALGSLPGVTDLTLVVNGQRIPLTAHTQATRAQLSDRGGLWRRADLSVLTHQVAGVKLPDHRTMLVSVHGRRGSEDVVVSQLWHVPPAATIALATFAHRLKGTAADAMGVSGQLRRLGIDSLGSLSPADIALLDTVSDSDQTAIALTSVHPNIATVAPAEAAATKSLLAKTAPVQTLGKTISQLQRTGKDYATLVTALDADGKPATIVIPAKPGGTPLATSFQTFRLNTSASGLSQALKSSVSAGVVGVRDTAELGAVIDRPLVRDKAASTKTWVQPEGVAPAATPVSRALKGSQIDITVKNTGLNSGTYVAVDGDYANDKVPLKLYNNYVRWVSVYVQYLGAGGKNLSANPSAKFPDTKYAKSLGLMPQVFTVLGIPLWDTNTLDVKLDFPPGAHSARLLLCGLGSDIVGGGWRQYFPADAYPDRIAPTDEVLVPALLTGILTIGMNVFALATDIDIASAWGAIKKEILEATDLAALFGDLNEILRLSQGIGALLAGEVAAATIAAGAATYEEAKANGDLSNLWNLLLGLASLIPKVLFSPKAAGVFINIALTIGALEVGEKLIDALPIIGQVIAVITAVGDAATLAEVCAETIASPWVIENEVSLTYKTTVTVSRDHRGSTWPVTARSWRLEALVDGALVLDPVTGPLNEGGKSRSDPLRFEVTAPFGGSKIQWSFVALDASGRQVATGVSSTYPNDDPDKPVKEVAFEITQLPATITSSTVFKRAATTTYDVKAGGYSWSDQVKVTGTVQTDHAQEATGTAVATLAGVAGVVFKQNDRYYLRGVPLAQDAATIKLGVAPTEGYARRPFLLLDPFVDKADRGNHVLLEPDDASNAYHVRRLTVDPVTGRLSWDPKESLGTFLVPVSAAALHSSGRVVAVHTNSGRLGWLSPVSTPRPVLAAYSAGPGTRVGLLSSPVAIAVTNPGVVLVLEAGATQISAFDLNGNPVRYFGAGSGDDRKFTRDLVSSGTPLDLAVDGADQIYVLYFTGSGSTPAEYHVDVYTRSGDVLDSHSPGVNVGRFAIDYWRSIYGANYDALTDLGTQSGRIDPRLKVPEPSLSRFDPTDETLSAPLVRRGRRQRGLRFTG
jgi:hypothetical protein